jgi:predicted nucleic acid-binding protein
MVFVLDASVTIAWAFADEHEPVAERAAHLLKSGSGAACVPDLWWYEVRNILLVGERRGRISSTGTTQFLRTIAQLQIERDSAHDDEPLLALARQYKLSVYDAAYLALAARQALPLATLDTALQSAAVSAGVALLA